MTPGSRQGPLFFLCRISSLSLQAAFLEFLSAAARTRVVAADIAHRVADRVRRMMVMVVMIVVAVRPVDMPVIVIMLMVMVAIRAVNVAFAADSHRKTP
jgi:hypothetical protein